MLDDAAILQRAVLQLIAARSTPVGASSDSTCGDIVGDPVGGCLTASL